MATSNGKKSGESQSTKKSHKYDLSDQTVADIKQTFEQFATEDKKHIQTKDLKIAMRALGFEPKKEEINKMILEIDKNKSDLITFDDFFNVMAKRLAEKDTNDEIMKAFQLFDCDQSGGISFENLKRVAKELGETISDEELKEMITEADRDGDGVVSSQDFLRIMKKTCLY
ncbi:uncharacterized protein LOC128966037 [Oppia nitens]|uniref:uncharacterized protein LOC128966037 n=1 Tax=Oppia nitens TaxID=1686743 RepID=UPI0023DB9395|nr:uncharacterized protein LOC128966037 [Oppia nitens]